MKHSCIMPNVESFSNSAVHVAISRKARLRTSSWVFWYFRLIISIDRRLRHNTTHWICYQPLKHLGEGTWSQLAMDFDANVDAEGLCESQGEELNIRCSMRKPFENGVNGSMCSAIWLGFSGRTCGRLITYPPCPSSWTLSHRFNISSQFSLVKFSSVALSENAVVNMGSIFGSLGFGITHWQCLHIPLMNCYHHQT